MKCVAHGSQHSIHLCQQLPKCQTDERREKKYLENIKNLRPK